MAYDYYADPSLHESDMALHELPRYWEAHQTFMTPDKAAALVERCSQEYWDFYRKNCPEYQQELDPEAPSPDEADMSAWKDKQAAFFEVIEDLEKYDFKKHLPYSPGWTDQSLIGSKFGINFPEYNEWRTEKALLELRENISKQAGSSGPLGGFDLSRHAAPEPVLEPEKQQDFVKSSEPVRRGRDLSGLPDIDELSMGDDTPWPSNR